MKFFKCAVYVLFALSMCNLGFSAYMFNELKKPNVIVAPHPEIKILQEQTMMRDTKMMEGILMTHHQIGLHKPGEQPMCPICEQMNDRTKTIQNPALVDND